MMPPLTGKSLTESIEISSDKVIIGGYEKYFQLKELQFERIKRGRPPLQDYAWTALGVTGGYILSLVPKFIDHGSAAISCGERITVVVLVVACSILFLVPRFQKNPRKEVMNEIEEFFAEDLQHSGPIMIGERE